MQRLALTLLLMVAGLTWAASPFPDGPWLDLTHALSSDSVFWPTAQPFRLSTDAEGLTDLGYYYSAYSFCTAEHGGTHIDAPKHFAEGRQAVDEIPLSRLIGAAIVVDVREGARRDRDYLIDVTDFERWEQRHGAIPTGAIVLLQTGYADYWPDAERYLGTAERGEAGAAKLHFPGLHPNAAAWLVARGIRSVGIDTASIDFGASKRFESHVTLMQANVPVFENLDRLDALPATGAFVVALPIKTRGGSGGPLRIVAWLPERGAAEPR